ncbi:hypothetical protein M9Y10_017323 [Tritrichomonas musculus]|uniref:Uncharacterized protein n=1 Tax=Tritrichomonas musculus TaxID=1915356 RepID=A0ABR2HU50_9EUKA
MSGINISRTHSDGINPVTIKFDQVKKYVLLPIEMYGPECKFYITSNNNQNHHVYNIRLAVTKVDYHVPLKFEAPDMHIDIFRAPDENAICWKNIQLSDTFDDKNREYYRPEYHFTPKYGWMNDPNGLFYLNGVYHLYFQYNPYASVWGNMHWGHATTKDFVHFEHHDVVLVPDELGVIYSGCIVIDKDNQSGFGANSIIAFYTSARRDDYTDQHICIAVSNDGFNFKKFEKNPIVSYNFPDFRDPCVVRYKNQWNMFVSTKQWMRIYSSQNLKDWKFESEFGHGVGCHDGVWECPGVFEIDGKWVMLVSINKGAHGGSFVQYFIGDFDGHEFKSDFDKDEVKWMDYGYDAYATIAFHDSPQLTSLSWMRHEEYDVPVPLKQFKWGFTIPRTYKIVNNTLYSLPLPSFESQFNKVVDKITPACLVEIELTDVTAKSVFITLKNETEHVEMEVNRMKDGIFYFERGIRSGIHIDLGDSFTTTTHAPYHTKDHYLIKLFIDKYSIEVFDAEGEFSMTHIVFPTKPYNEVVVQPVDGKANHKVTVKTT